MRREKPEHRVTTEMIEEKRSRCGKQREKMLDGQTKWLKVGTVTAKGIEMRGRSRSPTLETTAPD